MGAFKNQEEDLNDRKDLVIKLDNFLKKLIDIRKIIAGRIKIVGELIGTFRGIYKDWNNIVLGSYYFQYKIIFMLIILLL